MANPYSNCDGCSLTEPTSQHLCVITVEAYAALNSVKSLDYGVRKFSFKQWLVTDSVMFYLQDYMSSSDAESVPTSHS